MLENRTNIILVKYVALLAFHKIVASHPYLVSTQQDVIWSCINDPDISIRLKALDLSAGMVSSENLTLLVEHLLKQLRNAPTTVDHRRTPSSVELEADSDVEDDAESMLRPSHALDNEQGVLPPEYKISILHQILNICSKDTYVNISDFEWYVEILMRLAKIAPRGNASDRIAPLLNDYAWEPSDQNIYRRIGQELRELAVRVTSVREQSVKVANTLLGVSRNSSSSNFCPVGDVAILGSAAWIVGEYAEHCVDAHSSLELLLNPFLDSFSPDVICTYLQAIPKIFARIVAQPYPSWNAERRTTVTLLATRITSFLEPFADNSDPDVQERAVQFLELIRLGSQTVTAEDPKSDQEPILLTKALPQLFLESNLNPVAPSAQRKVPSLPGLDLTKPINNNLHELLRYVDERHSPKSDVIEFESFYKQRPSQSALVGPSRETLPSPEFAFLSYQQSEESATDTDTALRRRLERREKQKDDPFYIGEVTSSGTSTPFHDILHDSNGETVDIDSIPIMELKAGLQLTSPRLRTEKQKNRRLKKVDVVQDITIDSDESGPGQSARTDALRTGQGHVSMERTKNSLLEVDASGLGGLALDAIEDPLDLSENATNKPEDLEMVEAMAEVERLRLEMQRASERVQAADGAPAEGTLVKMRKSRQTRRGSRARNGKETLQKSSAKDGHDIAKRKRKKKKSPSIEMAERKLAGCDN